MYTSFKLMSHIFDGKRDGQLLVDHLNGVKNIVIETSKYKGLVDDEIEEVIKIIAMSHDFGKASKYFQDYLKGKYNGNLKRHGEISAYFSYYLLPKRWKVLGFICVKRHHGDIDIEGSSFFTCSDEEKLIKISKSIKENKEELEVIYDLKLDEFFESIENGELIKEVRRCYRKRNSELRKKTVKEQQEDFLYFQYLWALLLTADKTQLITGKTFCNKSIFKEVLTKNYKDNLREALIKKIPDIDKAPLFNIRDEIYNSIAKTIDALDLDKDKLLSINVPTGTGKTISVYGAAFRLSERLISEKGIIPNIIYNIPFMSVIDQNYDVLQEVLQLNNIECQYDAILKHHSMSPINYKDSEEKEYKNYDARFLVENWQSTIITTTFVQLFDTIFKSGVNSIIHRFHRLAGAIIILDEVQAVPPKYHPLINDILKIICERFNTYIITVTATKPLFLEGKELVINNKTIFEAMNRIVFENHTDRDLTLDEFKDIVLADISKETGKSFLIILNTVNSTRKVYEYIKEMLQEKRKVIYLSTEIIPRRRLEIIKEIKNSKDKYVLVSTQLIEAGVDLDFDVVYRDIAPMDCINQSAGRANRNGVKLRGTVKLFSLIDDRDKRFASYVYDGPLLDATLDILHGRKIIEENQLWEINNTYFLKLKEVTENKSLEEYKKYCDSIFRLEFQQIREFELIEDNKNKIDVIIRHNKEAEGYIDIIENSNNIHEYQKVINPWRGLNKYRISVNRDIVENMTHEIKGTRFLNKEDYDEETGIVRRTTSFI